MKRSLVERIAKRRERGGHKFDPEKCDLADALLKADDALRWHEKWNKHWRPEDDAALLEDEGLAGGRAAQDDDIRAAWYAGFDYSLRQRGIHVGWQTARDAYINGLRDREKGE